MPTRVEAAAKAAHEEISSAVNQIENSLPASSRSSSSPLFRDEVELHEMRSVDRLLVLERRPVANDNCRGSQSKMTDRKKFPKKAKTAGPSKSKRRAANWKCLRRAQVTSRRIVAKVARLGRRFTRNMVVVEDLIRHGVARAMAAAHSMLDDVSSSSSNGTPGVEREAAEIRANGNAMHVAASSRSRPTASRRDPLSTREPRNEVIALMPLWVWSGTKSVSSKVIRGAFKKCRVGGSA